MRTVQRPAFAVDRRSASRAWDLLRAGALAAALIAAACGGGEAGTPDGGGTSDGGGGTSDGGGGGGGCTPLGATVLADFANFDESPAYSMHLFGDRLFVQYIEQVVELPASGGAPTERYRSPNEFSTGIGTYRRNDAELVLVPSGAAVSILPIAGGAATQPAVDRTNELVVGFDTATDALVIQAAVTADTHDLALVPLDGSPRRIVAAAQAGGSFATRWFISGGYAVRTFDGSSASLELVALADGTRQMVAVAPSASRVHFISPTDVYYTHGEDLAQVGLWRQPLAGGAAVRVVDEFVFGGQFVAGGGRYGYHVADRIFIFGEGAPGVPATRLDLPVAGTNCTSHALALSADALYSTMYRSLAETSMVFRAAR